jgi:TolB protein
VATCGMGGGHAHPGIGGQLLYYCWDRPMVNGGIYLLDVTSGAARALTPDLAYNLDGAWAPDVTRIAFQSTRDGRDDIYTMNLEGGDIRRLTDGRGFNEYPSWSPDGQWILFNGTRDGLGDSRGTGYYRDLYLMRPDGTGVRRLIRHTGTYAFGAWSPDGRSIAFQADIDGRWQVYTMGVDGSGLLQRTHQVSTAGSVGFPRWSPDGKRLVFGASITGETESIYWLELGSGEVHRVTFGGPGLEWDGFPDWMPDGRWIVFTRTAGVSQLYAVRPDGSELTQLTEGPGYKALPRWRPQ